MGRLGSSWFRRPKHLGKDPGPLSFRFRQLVQRNIRDRFPRRSLGDLNRLDRQIENFEAAYRQLEHGRVEDLIMHTKLVIKQAFVLTRDGVKLPTRLKDLGWPETQLDVREIREIGKLANYWRISRHLALCSRRFRSLFENVELQFLPSYSPSSKSRAFSKQYIHAEIQLLVHYELTTLELKPRAIGVSKEACFLCDAFIRAHNCFSVTGAHRQMFPQWTVPDLEEFTTSTIQSFQRVLSQVCEEVKREYLKSQQKSPWRPFPAQSAINLAVIHLDTPSTSTLPLRSTASSIDNRRSTKSHKGCVALEPYQTEESASDLEQNDGQDCIEPTSVLSSAIGRCGCPNSQEEEMPAIPVEIVVDEAFPERIDWLRFFATSSPVTSSRRTELEQPQFVKATISLQPATGVESHRAIHMASIPSHGELVLERDICDDLHQLSFLLVGPQGPEQPICVRCHWRTS